MTTAAERRDLQRLEIDLLLQGMAMHYGYDFRNYAKASLLSRITSAIEKEGVATISALQAKILHEPACMQRFIDGLAAQTTTMFQGPDFYRLLRESVVPLLRTYPFVRIWHAGCSSGEEVYSVAIILHEAGLHGRTRLYATDISAALLDQASRGVLSVEKMSEHTRNYQRSGGIHDFSSYCTGGDGRATFRDFLRENIVFSEHNLASDGPFNEFNLILCRNVMTYFDETLAARAHALLYDSLSRFGMLALGPEESLSGTPFENAYEELAPGSRIYRRKA